MLLTSKGGRHLFFRRKTILVSTLFFILFGGGGWGWGWWGVGSEKRIFIGVEDFVDIFLGGEGVFTKMDYLGVVFM